MRSIRIYSGSGSRSVAVAPLATLRLHLVTWPVVIWTGKSGGIPEKTPGPLGERWRGGTEESFLRESRATEFAAS